MALTPRPSSLRSLIGLALAFLTAIPAGAGTVRFTRDGLNAREAMYFRGRGNVRTTVPKGTEGDILARFELPSGNYAIKLKVTKLGDPATKLKIDEEVWVYYHQLDANARRIELFDDNGAPQAEAKDGTWAVALNSFKVAVPTEAKKEEPCTICHTNPEPQKKTEPVNAVVVEEIKEIVNETNDAPNLDVGTEEIVTYIQNDRRKNGTKGDEASARAIAKRLIDECAKATPRVPLALALSVMQQESHFSESAKSHAGAMGLMQLMPDTYFEFIGRPDLYWKKVKPLKGAARAELIARRNAVAATAMEPETNIHYGVKMLSKLLKRYGEGRLGMVIAAYNGGPGGAAKWAKGNGRSETKAYVPIVKKNIASANQKIATYIAYEKASATDLNVASVD